jgi:hypothetical protein
MMLPIFGEYKTYENDLVKFVPSLTKLNQRVCAYSH